jgi:hypothetical protein
MMEDYGETVKLEDESIEPSEGKRDNKIWIILAVVAAVVLCCCLISCLGLVWVWNEGGDLILDSLDLKF